MEQRMGLPPNHKAGPFQSVAVEVVGPIEYQGRRAGKGWGVVFVCTTTSAAHIEFAATCSSTDSFLMALRRFMCFKGTPSQFQSDRNEQLVAAAKQASLWDFKEVVQWAGEKGIEWFLSPAGLNRQTEKVIELVKRQIGRSFEGRKYSYDETTAILMEAAQKVNRRPPSRNPWPREEQPELGPPQREQHVPQQPQKEQPGAELFQKLQRPQGAACGNAAP